MIHFGIECCYLFKTYYIIYYTKVAFSWWQISKEVPGAVLGIEREGHTHAFSCTEAGSLWVAHHVANLIKTRPSTWKSVKLRPCTSFYYVKAQLTITETLLFISISRLNNLHFKIYEKLSKFASFLRKYVEFWVGNNENLLNF